MCHVTFWFTTVEIGDLRCESELGIVELVVQKNMVWAALQCAKAPEDCQNMELGWGSNGNIRSLLTRHTKWLFCCHKRKSQGRCTLKYSELSSMTTRITYTRCKLDCLLISEKEKKINYLRQEVGQVFNTHAVTRSASTERRVGDTRDHTRNTNGQNAVKEAVRSCVGRWLRLENPTSQ